MNAKTIQIFLPDGSPRSIRIAEITSRIAKVILIPRNKLEEAANRNELNNVGIYFLFGSSNEKAKDLVYIGEAEDCYKRLKQHNKAKGFWNVALVVVSKTNSFTKSHVKYLEHFAYKKAKEIGRYEVVNDTIPNEPFVTESMHADLMDHFETTKILLSTLGYPLFEEVHRNVVTKEVLVCKGRDAYATGEYTDDGLVVYKGSTANFEETRTAGPWVRNLREKLLNSGVLEQKEHVFIFTSDYVFSSPSAAAAAVLGRRANGWTEWKDKEGRTLDELKRKE
ncbi:GIY-YIG nuclease family protein [Bacillus sp. V3B]|uniref:GIY-YIG nuclease family protein n=1 Tax=Bacillus sp. V3B TaxID=2804915 RepID=UPI00210E17E1|nr:GIY-YIG nuclease family protein [Bacillus sp. V3B]MCQ6277081.1 GIY-YIG nuclease family protein [Bacillus sp. V3B]